jgi:REP element-mobilizing transposase RayT
VTGSIKAIVGRRRTARHANRNSDPIGPPEFRRRLCPHGSASQSTPGAPLAIALGLPRAELRRLAARGDYIGRRAYFITINVYGRYTVFRSTPPTEIACAQLLRTAASSHFALSAFVFMPDHLHIVTNGLSNTADLRSFMHLFKQTSAYYLRQLGHEKVWRSGYYDRIIRRNENLAGYIDYVRNNPIKAGLGPERLESPYMG